MAPVLFREKKLKKAPSGGNDTGAILLEGAKGETNMLAAILFHAVLVPVALYVGSLVVECG